MDAVQLIRSEIKTLANALEGMSKRLRKVEVLSRLSVSSDTNTFLQLLDVDEDTYDAQAGLFVRVNLDETGLEFSPVGSACVTFICGSPGWRGYGGNPVRTLIHEEAFQLDADGDVRGADAVDLQHARTNANEVAGAEGSFIAGGTDNRIDSGADYSAAIGAYNWIATAASGTPYECYAVGSSNIIYGIESFAVFALGESHNIEDCVYGFFAGQGHQTINPGIALESTFGVFSLGEQNDFEVTAVSHYPTYSGSFGILNEMFGDVFNSYQFGEAHTVHGGDNLADNSVWNSLQVGYSTYLKNVFNNFAFGYFASSVNPTPGTAYYNGRIVMANGLQVGGPGSPHIYGYNQDSIFFQNYKVTSWPAAFTTAFQFPIIVDSIWHFEAYIAGTEQGCANSYAWKVEGVVENDGGTTTILVQTVTNIYRDVVTKEWQAAADDANDRLLLQFRDTAGPDATDCNIMLRLHTVEVGWHA